MTIVIIFSRLRRIAVIAGCAITLSLGTFSATALAATSSHTATVSARAQGYSSPNNVETAVPDTGTGCNPDPVSPVTECTTVIGTGLKVSSISGWTVNETFGKFNNNLHIEIYGPQGHLGNCAPFSLGGLATGPTCIWRNPHPNVNVKGGDYCSRVWELASGKYKVLSAECVNVHS